MNSKQTHCRILGSIAALALVAVVATAASAATDPEASANAATAAATVRGQALNERYGTAATKMSAAEWRAIYVRSVALDQRYHLGDYATSPSTSAGADTAAAAATARGQALNERYGTAATKMSAAEWRALYLRDIALNQRYHLGDYARSAARPSATNHGGGFDWTTTAIALAAGLGLILLAAAALTGTGHRPHRPLTHSH